MQRGTAGRYRILLPKGKGGEEGHTGLSPHGWAWGAALRYTSSSRSLLLCSFIGLFCSLIGLFCSRIGLFCSLLLTYRPLLLIYRPLLLIYRPLLLVHRPLLEEYSGLVDTHMYCICHIICHIIIPAYVTSSYLHMSHHPLAYRRDAGLVDTHVRILQRL